MKYAIGCPMVTRMRRRQTPKNEARTGKTAAWMKSWMRPLMDMMMPTFCRGMPSPPPSAFGESAIDETSSARLSCRKMGSKWSYVI